MPDLERDVRNREPFVPPASEILSDAQIEKLVGINDYAVELPIDMVPVSKAVNSPKNNSPELLEPVELEG